MNAKRILDVVALISVGDGALWVLAPRRRGLLWLVGPGPVKRFVGAGLPGETLAGPPVGCWRRSRSASGWRCASTRSPEKEHGPRRP